MQLANQEAQRFNHEYIGTEHILIALVKESSGVASHVLCNLGLDLRKVRLEVEKLVQSGPDMVTMGKLPQTPRVKKVIQYAMAAVRERDHNYIGTEHLLIGLLGEKDGTAWQVLQNLEISEQAIQDVDHLLGVTPKVLERASKTVLEEAIERAVTNQDFETASRLDEQRKIQKGTSDRHRDALLEVASALFAYVGDCDAKKALESISQIADSALSRYPRGAV
jgi:ATP-dependent Clp protease ATP-binding subunit ClpA